MFLIGLLKSFQVSSEPRMVKYSKRFLNTSFARLLQRADGTFGPVGHF